MLQEREFQRLGGTRTIKSNVRIIAATNRDLSTAIARGGLPRGPLHRLNVFEIALPPLPRSRPRTSCRSATRSSTTSPDPLGRAPARLLLGRASASARARLAGKREAAAERAGARRHRLRRRDHHARATVAAGSGGKLGTIARQRDGSERDADASATPMALAALERAAIERALAEARFNKSKAARAPGLTTPALRAAARIRPGPRDPRRQARRLLSQRTIRQQVFRCVCAEAPASAGRAREIEEACDEAAALGSFVRWSAPWRSRRQPRRGPEESGSGSVGRPLAVGVQLDLFPTIVSAANGKLGHAADLDRHQCLRLRLIGAHLEPPDAFAFDDDFETRRPPCSPRWSTTPSASDSTRVVAG
ncbi:MAG: sigma 54-interacting transcriptional regulator [bacterium]